jgi:hypothetical protein
MVHIQVFWKLPLRNYEFGPVFLLFSDSTGCLWKRLSTLVTLFTYIDEISESTLALINRISALLPPFLPGQYANPVGYFV